MGKQLDKFDLCYDKPAILNKDALSAFKKRVLQCIDNDAVLKSRNPKFKIQIEDNSLIRYVYEIDIMETVDAADIARLAGFLGNFSMN